MAPRTSPTVMPYVTRSSQIVPSGIRCTGFPLLPHNGPIAARTAPDRNAAYVAVMWNRFR
jgi:hypothetical protein